MRTTVPLPFDVKLMNITARALFVAFALLVAGALADWAVRSPAFDIAGITVTGDVTHNNALTLRANVAPQLSGTFFTLDLTVARQVFESVPWVRHAVVRREFPNRLKVVLQEHQAVAYWGDEAELVNSYGEVFEANVGEIEQDGLPNLKGPDDQAAQVLTMFQLIGPLFERMDMAIDELELTDHGDWRTRLNTGATIELGGGPTDDVLARVQRFLKTLTQVSSRYGRHPDALETADLRHQDGYAIRLRGVTTVAAALAKK
jgi:cell division protein FtsQ